MKKKRKRHSVWRRLGIALVLAAAVFFLLSRLLLIRSFNVVGNRLVSRDEIIERSGIHTGDSFLTLNRQQIRHRLEENRYVQYKGLGYDYKGMLTIHIHERSNMGYVRAYGVQYMLDESGIVLESTAEDLSEVSSGPEITGLQLSANVPLTVGEALPVHDELQLDQMKRVLKSLSEVNMLARATKVDVEYSDNLTVMTREGAGINLGDDSNLILKLMIAREVLAIRKEEGDVKGAWIDVSSGRDAHYIPKILPTITPTPTATPTIEPEETPKTRKK